MTIFHRFRFFSLWGKRPDSFSSLKVKNLSRAMSFLLHLQYKVLIFGKINSKFILNDSKSQECECAGAMNWKALHVREILWNWAKISDRKFCYQTSSSCRVLWVFKSGREKETERRERERKCEDVSLLGRPFRTSCSPHLTTYIPSSLTKKGTFRENKYFLLLVPLWTKFTQKSSFLKEPMHQATL